MAARNSPSRCPKTALRSAISVADQIRRAVMTKELMKRSSGERLGRVTISIGVALLRPTDTPQSLIERADNCLYAAKRNGRNRVVCESDPQVAARATPPPRGWRRRIVMAGSSWPSSVAPRRRGLGCRLELHRLRRSRRPRSGSDC